MAPYFSSSSTFDPSEPNHVVLDGRFRLMDPIGGGGSSIVYRAQHSTVDREVAVKIFEQTHLELPGALERFENEVRIIATLRHPNTVRLIDAGRYGTRGAYIVTELLRGESLAEVLERGPLSEERALRIGAQIAASLAEAHDHGIVHRDLKPTNVFLERIGDEEHVKVLDFGIAKMLDPIDPDDTLTRPGALCGTPGYMSPEQIFGDPIDARADIYALGVLLYRCLTGLELFTANDTIALLRQHALEVPEISSRICGDPTVRTLLRHMLAKIPSQRPSSMHIVAAALRKAIERTRNRVSEQSATMQKPAQPRTVTPLPRKVVRKISSHTVLTAVLTLELLGVCAALAWG